MRYKLRMLAAFVMLAIVSPLPFAPIDLHHV